MIKKVNKVKYIIKKVNFKTTDSHQCMPVRYCNVLYLSDEIKQIKEQVKWNEVTCRETKHTIKQQNTKQNKITKRKETK